jgi:hypothetical protein
MTTSKRSYSGVTTRPSHTKNKSLVEVKDLLPKNIYSNPTIHSNQSPTFTFESQTRGQRDLLSKSKVTYSLFDEVSAAGKTTSSYARSLLNKIKEDPTPTRYESKIEKGHQRVKSSIIDMYPSKYFSSIERLEEDEKPSCSGNSFVGRYQGNNSRGAPLSHEPLHNSKGSTDELVNRLIEEHRLAKERERERESSLQREEAGLGKEGRRLGDFLSKGGFLKDKASPTTTDGLRPKMKELSTEDLGLGSSTYEKRSGAVKLMMSQSPKEGIEETINQKGAEYMNNLDGYLDYLRTNRRLSNNEVNGEEKMKSLEEETRDADIKFMKKQIEDVNSKLNEVTKINMKLMKEFSSMLIREQESSQKFGHLEEKFVQLKNKNKKYKKELRYTIQVLEKERIENQNNLLALKKILANDINNALHTKSRNQNYGSHKDLLIHHHRDRSGPKQIEVDTSMKGSRKSSEKRQSQKRPENITVGPNALLFANYGSGSPYTMGKSDDSEIEDQIEEETENLQTTEQDTDEGFSSANKQPIYRSPQKGNKENSKEEQIRMLQEKIAEVMVSRNSPVKSNKQGQERGGPSQVWPKNIEVLSQNYMNQQSKSGKHSNKHTIGTKESTDYHHSKAAQSTYHSRGEGNFE